MFFPAAALALALALAFLPGFPKPDSPESPAPASDFLLESLEPDLELLPLLLGAFLNLGVAPRVRN